jgi:hemerythrin-like domain-containing protein
MKRSEALAGLSRDHHKALAVALRLRRAGPDSVVEAVAGFRDYFETAGNRHFELEEAVLLPALPDEGGWATLTERVREEHRSLREAGARTLAAAREDAAPQARQLGEALDAHVRFEERQLFPFLEQRLTAAQLSDLGRRLADAHPSAP